MVVLLCGSPGELPQLQQGCQLFNNIENALTVSEKNIKKAASFCPHCQKDVVPIEDAN
jgi:hypothetical protein